MKDSIPKSWKTKRWLWTRWHTLRYSLAKPQKIGPPKPDQERINTVALSNAQPGIPAEKVQVFASLPKDEKSSGIRSLGRLCQGLSRPGDARHLRRRRPT